MTPPIFSSENFRTFAVDKEKGFEFRRKIFELGPLFLRCHDDPLLRCLCEMCNYPDNTTTVSSLVISRSFM